MPSPIIERIEIEGFTSIIAASVGLRRLNVLVGANGAGKSNLVRVLEVLGRVVDEDLQVHVARSGGAAALVNAGLTNRRIRIALPGHRFGLNRYIATLAPTPDGGLFFEDEQIGWPDPRSSGIWVRRSIGRGHFESQLHGLVAAGNAVEPLHTTAAELIELLRGCRVYHFHDTSPSAPVKQLASDADNLTLRPDAGNLAAVLYRLQTGDSGEQAAYRRIVGAVRQVAPFFREFVLAPERQDQLRLRWKDHGADAIFSAHQMSDGTLRFVCLATLLLQPKLPALIALDEPELGMHPYAIVQLADLLRQAATRSQVVIATQSVTLMNQFELDDLIVVERGAEGSSFVRPDADRLRGWLDDYSLGELWEKNLIGGRPGRADG